MLRGLKFRFFLPAAVALVSLAFTPAITTADTLSGSVTITDPNQDTVPAGTLTYHGFFTNTGDIPEVIEGGVASVSCDAAGCPGFHFSSLQSVFGTILDPGASTSLMTLFGLTVPSDFSGVTLPDTYSGSFNGGCFLAVGGNIGTCPGAAFSATVTAPVPEPATMLLLGTGMFALGAARRRKLNRTS